MITILPHVAALRHRYASPHTCQRLVIGWAGQLTKVLGHAQCIRSSWWFEGLPYATQMLIVQPLSALRCCRARYDHARATLLPRRFESRRRQRGFARDGANLVTLALTASLNAAVRMRGLGQAPSSLSAALCSLSHESSRTCAPLSISAPGRANATVTRVDDGPTQGRARGV